MRSVVQLVRHDLEHFGPWRAAYDVLVRTINRVLVFKTLKVLKIACVDPKFLRLGDEYQARFLNEAEMAELVEEPEFEVDEEFLAEAAVKGDACFGIFAGRRLVSYAWYSTEPTLTSDGVVLSVPRGQIYMYKAFTRPERRGRRLTAFGSGLAIAHYLSLGYSACVLFVESNNFSSLQAFGRLGATRIGWFRLLKLRSWAALTQSRELQASGVRCRLHSDAETLALVGVDG